MRDNWKHWKKGDRLTMNRIQWTEKELKNVLDVFERDWFGMGGYYVKELEWKLKNFIGIKHATVTSSGSSALLLATWALQHRGDWQKGDYILHPACTFPTSLNPIIQAGMFPVFVDVEKDTYNIDIDMIRYAIKRHGVRIKGAIIPHLLGNCTDMDSLLSVLDGRPLIEDVCDTLGSEFDGKRLGTFGTLSAFSFYASHHVTSGGVGGAIATDNDVLAKIVDSMCYWGREWADENASVYEKFSRRYNYATIGTDFQMSEMQAAFGCAQMDKLQETIENRNYVYSMLVDSLKPLIDKGWIRLPKIYEKAKISWFGLPLFIDQSAPFLRRHFVEHLNAYNIEARPLMAGCILMQPAYKGIEAEVEGSIHNSMETTTQALFIPAWGMSNEALLHMIDAIESFEAEG